MDPFDPAQRASLTSTALHRRSQSAFLTAVPNRYRGASLAGVQAAHGDEVWRPLAAWCGRPTVVGSGLILLGPPGVGKTWAAWAALRSLARDGDVVGGTLANVLDSLRPSDDGDYAVRQMAWRRFTGDAGVLIDDVGAEKLTEWAAATLDSIVDARWTASRRTIVTSNLTVEALRDHLGARAWSRLTDGGSLVLRLSGPDLRRSTNASPT